LNKQIDHKLTGGEEKTSSDDSWRAKWDTSAQEAVSVFLQHMGGRFCIHK